MILSKIVDELADDEGYSSTPYRCTAGAMTIGYGHNLDAKGLTKKQSGFLKYNSKDFSNLTISITEARSILEDDIFDSVKELNIIFDEFLSFSDEIQHILINLHFQLGYSKFMGFRDMIRAIKKQDWKEAAVELRDSKLWRKDTHTRAERLAKRFENEAKK